MDKLEERGQLVDICRVALRLGTEDAERYKEERIEYHLHNMLNLQELWQKHHKGVKRGVQNTKAK